MKKMRKIISAAEAADDTRLKDAIDMLEDDFDYAIAGLEKLGRSGRSNYENAVSIANTFSAAVAQVIDKIADEIQEVE